MVMPDLTPAQHHQEAKNKVDSIAGIGGLILGKVGRTFMGGLLWSSAIVGGMLVEGFFESRGVQTPVINILSTPGKIGTGLVLGSFALNRLSGYALRSELKIIGSTIKDLAEAGSHVIEALNPVKVINHLEGGDK